MKIYILKNCTCSNRKKKEMEGNRWSSQRCDLLRKIRGHNPSNSNPKKRFELFTFFNRIPILIVFYLLFEFSEFTGAIVQDLSIGRSPIIFINRFRIHCSNPHANWFGSFSFNYIDDRI